MTIVMGAHLVSAAVDADLGSELHRVALTWGLPTVVVVALSLVAAHFGAFQTAVTWLWRGVALVSTYGLRRSVERRLATTLNTYLDGSIFRRFVATTTPQLEVRMVQTAHDARTRADGRVIVRVRQDRDEDLSQLYALLTAIGQVLFPSIRGWLNETTRKAIDLQVVSEFTLIANPHIRLLFQTHILQPQLAADPKLGEMLANLHEIADAGLFEPILLQELQRCSDDHLTKPPSGLAAETDELIRWLHRLAVREAGDDQGDLNLINRNFKTSILLAAKRVTAAQGTEPYRRRTRRNLFAGARHMYLLGLTREHGSFVDEIAAAIKRDGWAILEKTVNTRRRGAREGGALRLVMFRRNEMRMRNQSYRTFASEEGATEGQVATGVIVDMNGENAFMRIGEVDAILPRHEIAWGYVGQPGWLLSPHAAISVQVTEIDEERCVTRVSAKHVRPNPWTQSWAPKHNERIKAEVVGVNPGGTVIVKVRAPQGAEGELFGFIPPVDWSWYSADDKNYIAPTAGLSIVCRVTKIEPRTDQLWLSRATTEGRDWEVVTARYPNGTEARARVVKVDHDGVRCELEPGVFGRVDRPEMERAGYEYRDFESTVVPGQALDVRIIGRREGRQFLKLALLRNE